MKNACIYLDSYILQSDMRIRLPKSIINNLNVIPGKTKFSIYLDTSENSIIMRICNNDTAATIPNSRERGQ